ncbi:MAG TPA: hypothetical protein VLA75_03995, partial [Thermoanaerobaculia bacterium]|nr:hypothetical protein [Thermoanaerobaculia bacterium]
MLSSRSLREPTRTALLLGAFAFAAPLLSLADQTPPAGDAAALAQPTVRIYQDRDGLPQNT